MDRKRIATIGAGPIGLEAALYAAKSGFDVAVFEKGEIGANIKRWGHVTLFTPWELNHSQRGVTAVSANDPTWHAPHPSALQTGSEYVERYLLPLSRTPELTGRIHTHSDVLFISRQGALKGDLIGKPARQDHPFRILFRSKDSRERVHLADIVIDASGVYGTHNWLGEGGIPAPGEISLQDRIFYHIPDFNNGERAHFAGKRTLLVGSGYSAATVVADFASLIREEPSTQLIWAVRKDSSAPIPVIENDPLHGRKNLTQLANALAAFGSSGITMRSGTTVEAISTRAKEVLAVTLGSAGKTDVVEVDNVIAMVGYGPDNSVYRELQVHECYASRGPMNLSAALLGASASADCLDQKSLGADTLKNPEPNFFIIGNKSYGRNPTFLINVGLNQIEEVFSLITDDVAMESTPVAV